MARIEIDMREVDQFAAELAKVPQELQRHGAAALNRFALDAKTAQQADLQGSSDRGFRAIAGEVRYDDIKTVGTGFETELGIDKVGAGNLGNIAIFGTWKGGGTHMHPSFHAGEAFPAFEAALAALAEELIP